MMRNQLWFNSICGNNNDVFHMLDYLNIGFYVETIINESPRTTYLIGELNDVGIGFEKGFIVGSKIISHFFRYHLYIGFQSIK
jgi:hypothetical protein